MLLCASSYPKRLAFALLADLQHAFFEELKNDYGASGGVDFRSLIETVERPYQFIKFDRTIQRLRVEYSDPRSSAAMTKLSNSLTEVTTIMRRNVEDILTRGENLDDVGRKASDLKYASEKFKASAKMLSFRALLQQYAPCLVFLVVVFLIICWRFLL
eukprot:GHVT01104086.1.p1 GENE.GHVT01104086.1~~GHVT01104086.1.p1  ORF type:complete len:158 (+),score=29.93 GHVT01104086.1:358-831(+)